MLVCRDVLIHSKAILITDDRIPRLDNSQISLMRNASSKYIFKEMKYLEILSQSKLVILTKVDTTKSVRREILQNKHWPIYITQKFGGSVL